MDPIETQSLNKSATRSLLVNPLLLARGWKLHDRSQVRFEVPVDGYDPTPWNGITDYTLYRPSAEVLSVVEAKRASRDPRTAEEQLRQYVTTLARRQAFAPFGFMSNGLNTWFWEVGLAHPRLVAGFFTPADLERLLFIRQNGQPLASTAINTSVVDRPYQHEAIRRVCEAFERGLRRALLVMATGSGKTRTVMALIDLFLRAHWAQKILFVADRDALVEQALNDGFKTFLPHEPRVRIHTANLDTDKRLYVATLQTMGRCFGKFSPGFFDLIIFDEAHRSIFNRFTEVIEHFDARMIGLTATPANFIDRDTFRTFACENQTPTFLYTYEQAVAEKRLVDFRLYQAHTGFQRTGIHGANLSEEDRNALIEQGLDPDQIDYTGTDLEILVSNKDTLRRQWEEIMEHALLDQGGQLPGKTIIFAMTREHAERIRDVFEEMYPQHVGLLQVIHYGMERVHDGPYGDGLISKFKKQDKPRIAVSVDMLDTGVDIPEVVNLVFMKPVQSRIKLWQMIGRGTRNHEACRHYDRLPDGRKTEFLILDFWQNDFGRQTDDLVPSEMPVLVRIFNTRLDLLEATLLDRASFAHSQAALDCRTMLDRIPKGSFPVRKVWHEVEPAWTDSFWLHVTRERIQFLRLKVAPLLRFAANVDVAAETFTNKVERLKLQILQGRPSPELLESIADDVSRLPGYVHQDSGRQSAIKTILDASLATATPQQLTQVMTDLAGEMRNRRERPSAFLKLDLPDFVAAKGDLIVRPSSPPVHVEEYRRRVEQRVQAVADRHPALAAIREGLEPTEAQLLDLERVLQRELTGGEVGLSPDLIRKAYGLRMDSRLGFLGFVRRVLDLDGVPDYEAVVARGIQDHVASHHYTGDQIRFLRAVQEVFLAKRRLTEADLYEPPLTIFGRNAVEKFFTPGEIREIVGLTRRLAA
ncbi:MAG: DEAD/DEAH box helicase family protein [Verrucomicrobiales bacterium]|nr:DEAD/DEAH box helicase family protein [Verrucomicrobiales bacterium]